MSFTISWQNLLGAFLVGGCFGSGWAIAQRVVTGIFRS